MDFLSLDLLIALVTLTSLEIVLGIDNVIFIAILAGRLAPEQRDRARNLGLFVAVVSRIALLCCIGWVIHLKEPLVHFGPYHFSGKELVVLFGGLFLIAKATHEIHQKVEGVHHEPGVTKSAPTMASMLFQVALIDIVFSLDSVITAVGMTNNLPIMIAAVIISIMVMLVFSGHIVRFVEEHPAIKLLALSFLILIGVLLVAEGFDKKFDKGYVYFAMSFSLAIELLQMRAERNSKTHAPHSP